MANKNKYYKIVEGMLYNYKKTQSEIKNLELEIEELENEYQECQGISYEESSTPTNKFNSSVENEVMNKRYKPEQLRKLKKKMQIQIDKIDNALEQFDDRTKQIIELKYLEKIPNKKIALRLDLTEQRICEIKTKAIKDLIPSIFVSKFKKILK